MENYEVVEVHRSQLKGAPYNPRVLSDAARDKLKEGIKRVGLLSPPVWNETTGNIVGGHQRLAIMDSMAGKADYTLHVARVRLDEKKEKEANLLLNNQFAMGDWDMGKLQEMLKEPGLDFSATGFDAADVYRMFGANAFEDQARGDELAAVGDKLRTAKDAFAGIGKKTATKDDPRCFTILVFESKDEAVEFNRLLGFDAHIYQPGARVRALFLRAKAIVDGEGDGTPDATEEG